MLLFVCYFLQDIVAIVWFLFPIHFQPMSVEAPEHFRTVVQEHRIGALIKIEFVPVWWIVVPEALVASKVREP